MTRPSATRRHRNILDWLTNLRIIGNCLPLTISTSRRWKELFVLFQATKRRSTTQVPRLDPSSPQKATHAREAAAAARNWSDGARCLRMT